MEAEPTIFVVDDDAAMRKSIAFAVRSAGLNVLACPSAEAFLAAWQPGQAGCLILDIRMPGMDGLTLQQTLAEREIGIPIIFVTGHGDIPMCADAMKAGAFDFLTKPFEKKRLLECIQLALKVDHQTRGHHDRRTRAFQCYQLLTEREREVMELLIIGKSTKEIASRLNISIKTVDNHRNRVLEKMAADNLVELTRLAVAYGIPAQHMHTDQDSPATDR